MTFLHPLDRPPAKLWGFRDGLLIGLVVGLCASLVLLFKGTEKTQPKCLLPLPMAHAGVVVNLMGDQVSVVMNTEEAKVEAARWESKYHANPKAGPYGWIPVVVVRQVDYDKGCR